MHDRYAAKPKTNCRLELSLTYNVLQVYHGRMYQCRHSRRSSEVRTTEDVTNRHVEKDRRENRNNRRRDYCKRCLLNDATIVIEESTKGNNSQTPVCFCLAPLSQTYHTLLSSITIIFYNITLFEHYTRVASKNMLIGVF